MFPMPTTPTTSTSLHTTPNTPPTTSAALRKTLPFFPSESIVNGTVIKVSDFGVYVDIGASVTAFLPKRKMKLTRRQMKYKPWEVHPLNSALTAYIHETDKVKNRIALTTYEPKDWDEKLPNKDYIITGQNSDRMVEDDEESGG